MAINKVIYSGTTLIDLSSDTVTDATHIMSGYVGHLADGTQVTGTGQGGSTSSQGIYCGSSAPSSSTGSDGDIYVTLSTGSTIERYPESFTSSNMNSTSNASKCIGVSASDGSATGNVYSSGSSTTGVIEYSFDFSSVPSTAAILDISCQVMAHEENSSRSSFTLQLYAGSTAKGSSTEVSGTSNTIYTLSVGSWTRSELDSLVLHTEYGYYGGLVAGATVSVTYETEASAIVSLTVTESGWTLESDSMYQKSSGAWSQVSSATLDDVVERK